MDRTDSKIDTYLTRAGSGFDLEDTRRDLIAMRTRLGADTPAGHRCSNIVAQLAALQTATDPEQRKAIKDGIKQQIMELANLSGGVQ